MNWQGNAFAFMALLALSFARPAMAHEPPTDGCGADPGKDARELAIMRAPAISTTAESNANGKLPSLVLNEHYAINLIAQERMRFTVRPGRGSRASSSRGGAFQFEVPVAGRYRVSITSRHWIDIVDGRNAVKSVDHHGPGCDVLHKIVEFDLPAGRPLTLQLSGQDDAIVGLAITASPPAPKEERS